ncbi:hypothetical protein [Halioxenophilus aromaticivorans]|uniref:hypothetical protein n=1 Tax=Halioxenophilus aromaticivorans TaxID=1306992 RepID=UPI0031E8117B
MKRILLSATLYTVFYAATVSALSPEFEADRLMLLAQEQIKDDQISQAEITLQQIQDLKVTPPSEYYFLKGQVLSFSERTQEAIDSLVIYIESSGKDAEYYTSSLRLISQLKDKQDSSKLTIEPNSDPNIEWTGTKRSNSYVDQLRFLYGAKSDQSALLQHINNMLNTYQAGSDTPGYALATQAPATLITRTKGTDGISEVRSTDKITLYGVNPYIEFSCTRQPQQCQLMHPATDQPWLTIAGDQQAAREISKAIAELIKLLQTGRQ